MPTFLSPEYYKEWAPVLLVWLAMLVYMSYLMKKEAIHVISWMASIALFAPMMGPLLGSFVLYFASWLYFCNNFF